MRACVCARAHAGVQILCGADRKLAIPQSEHGLSTHRKCIRRGTGGRHRTGALRSSTSRCCKPGRSGVRIPCRRCTRHSQSTCLLVVCESARRLSNICLGFRCKYNNRARHSPPETTDTRQIRKRHSKRRESPYFSTYALSAVTIRARTRIDRL